MAGNEKNKLSLDQALNGVLKLPVGVECPATGKIRRVKAVVDKYSCSPPPWARCDELNKKFGKCIARLSYNIQELIGIKPTELIPAWDPNGGEGDWAMAPVVLHFHQQKIEGPALLVIAGDTTVYKPFLEQIERRDLLPQFRSREDNEILKVFLAHSSQDKPFVRWLAKTLINNGFMVWLDEIEMRVGDSLVGKIGLAVSESDYVVAVISEHSIVSNWVQKELALALAQELDSGDRKILPVLKSDVDIPPFLKDKLYADFRDEADPDLALARLMRAIEP